MRKEGTMQLHEEGGTWDLAGLEDRVAESQLISLGIRTKSRPSTEDKLLS